MERAKYIFGSLALILPLFTLLPMSAQPNAETIYDACLSGKMERWSQVIDAMESEKLTAVNDKLKTPILGPLSMKYIKMAYETDPNNIQALSDMGNMLYYAPVVFGGDKQ